MVIDHLLHGHMWLLGFLLNRKMAGISRCLDSLITHLVI